MSVDGRPSSVPQSSSSAPESAKERSMARSTSPSAAANSASSPSSSISGSCSTASADTVASAWRPSMVNMPVGVMTVFLSSWRVSETVTSFVEVLEGEARVELGEACCGVRRNAASVTRPAPVVRRGSSGVLELGGLLGAARGEGERADGEAEAAPTEASSGGAVHDVPLHWNVLSPMSRSGSRFGCIGSESPLIRRRGSDGGLRARCRPRPVSAAPPRRCPRGTRSSRRCSRRRGTGRPEAPTPTTRPPRRSR